MARGPRPYDSPLRDEQARLTRRRILQTAHRLLLDGGYGAMTVAGLAREAGVSVQTVYNSVGGKADVVKAVYDVALAGDDEPVRMIERPAFQALLAERNPRRWFVHYAAFARSIVEGTGPLVTLLLAQAAAGDPDLAEFAATIERERAIGTARAAELFASRFSLRAGVTVERAADILWTLTAPEIADRLIRRRGWTPDAYEAWLGTTMADALVGRRRTSSN
jgi:AcrR family transcriptional regulator